jgi:GntR family transcriptional regulator
VVLADERVARYLRLAPREPVVVRRRLRSVDGEPYSTADSYYPRSVVAGTAVELPEDVLPGVYAVFEQLGRPWVRTVDQWISRAPTREEIERLHIGRGISVAEVVRISYDADDIPLRLSLFVLPGDKHIVEYIHTQGVNP